MKDLQIHLINKMFNNDTIRTVWNKEEEKYYISVIDVIRFVFESNDGRKYWNKLKQCLKEKGNETVTNCHRLKLKVQDGKYRMTDVVDIEVIFADLGEIATIELAKEQKLYGLDKIEKLRKWVIIRLR